MRVVLSLLLVTLACAATAHHEPWTTTVYPQDRTQWWWDDGWWERGELERPQSYPVKMREIVYKSGDAEVPAYVFEPEGAGPFPPVLFQHGRRGLDNLTLRIPRRLAARGFTVLAPDVWTGRFIEKYPVAHDYAVEEDVARGIDVLLGLPGVKHSRACAVSHTRGGYLVLKALTTHARQRSHVACYVSYYPHWQDPNAPEAMQVYRYAPEVERLEVPVLVFIGEHEQYNRLRPIVDGISQLERLDRPARLIVYPGVGRGFDFRPRTVRTFADDLAAKDAAQRTAAFIRQHLGREFLAGAQRGRAGR